MMRPLFPALLCDIGGTNARFAVVADAVAPLTPLPPGRTDAFPTFNDAVRATLAAAGVVARTCIVSAAGPVDDARVKLTNAGWTIDGRATAAELGFAQGLILNDFEALALSIPSLKSEWMRRIGPANGASAGARLIHGPGTGLGSAALISIEGRWRAIASEGSHSDFAPVYADEAAIWPFIEPRLGRITPETLISGPGLRRLHRARRAARGLERPEISDAEIIARAVGDVSSDEAETVRLFWRLGARYAGDVALNFLATGGVYLAGGILPRILALLDESDYRRVFEHKAPYEELVGRIPVWLITTPDVVMQGLAAIARNPDGYLIDYTTRAWA